MTILEEYEQLDQSYWDQDKVNGLTVDHLGYTGLKARHELMRKYYALGTPEVLIPIFQKIDLDAHGTWDMYFYFGALEKFKKAALGVELYQKVLRETEKSYWKGVKDFRKRFKYQEGNPADIDPLGARTVLYEGLRVWLHRNYGWFKINVEGCSQIPAKRRKELIQEIDTAVKRISLEAVPERKINPDKRELTSKVFWELIEATHTDNPDDQLEALSERLAGFPPKQIRQFKKHLRKARKAASTWDLWGAGYLLNGGCSDDGFDYFINWLILQGEQKWKQAVKDADSIAKWVKYSSDAIYEAEELSYLADEVIEELTGNPGPDGIGVISKVTGKKWEEEDLEGRLPKLFKVTSE